MILNFRGARKLGNSRWLGSRLVRRNLAAASRGGLPCDGLRRHFIVLRLPTVGHYSDIQPLFSCSSLFPCLWPSLLSLMTGSIMENKLWIWINVWFVQPR